MWVEIVLASQASAPACSDRPAIMNGRLPRRSEKTPARGATTIVAPVHTSSFSPACSGVLPRTSCMYWERKKIEPNMPKYMLSDTTFVTAKERLAKKYIG